jgi:hypothetical protein
MSNQPSDLVSKQAWPVIARGDMVISYDRSFMSAYSPTKYRKAAQNNIQCRFLLPVAIAASPNAFDGGRGTLK